MLFTFCYQICMFHAWFFIIICKIYQKYWNFDKKIGFLGLPGIKVWPNCLFLGSIIMSWAHTHGWGVQNWIRKKSKKNGSKLTPSFVFENCVRTKDLFNYGDYASKRVGKSLMPHQCWVTVENHRFSLKWFMIIEKVVLT